MFVSSKVIPVFVRTLINVMLSDRDIYSKWNEKMDQGKINDTSLQGISKLLNCCWVQDSWIWYIFVRGKDGEILPDHLQRVLRIIQTWCETKYPAVNPSKIDIVVFTVEYTRKLKRQSIYYGQRIPFVGVKSLSMCLWYKTGSW